jgi:polyisoprenyl-teichoic acid--peptidoglycan teichoic acid transferase
MSSQPNLRNGRAWPGSESADPVSQLCYNALAIAISLLCSIFPFMNPPSRPSMQTNRPRREVAVPAWAVGVFLGVFVLIVGLSGYVIFTSVQSFVRDWNITPLQGPIFTQGTPAPTNPGGGGKTQPTNTAPSIIPKRWTGTERVTVLLTGIDFREGITCEDQGKASRTDSIMVATLDPVGMTAAVLSIPRDLWVEIPGYENDTINTANFRGDAYNYPGGGPALAVKTVEYNFGIKVDYYVRMDFTAFEKIIDTVGGIDINNKEAIDDPEYPDSACGFEPFVLSAGPHHLNGHDALRYARTRHNSTDIARGERQQEVVLAVLKRVKDPTVLPTLMTQAPGLYQTLNDNVKTNLTLDQIVSLGLLAKDIPLDKVRREGITYEYVQEYTTDTGRQVLLPWKDKIRELVNSLFANTAIQPRATLAPDDPAKRAAEAAKVEVLNGAGVQGLAQATADWLKPQGVNVISVGTADRIDYTSTVIMDYTGKAYTARWLAQLFNVGEANILSGSDPASPVDIKVILGQDWTAPTASSP